MRKITGLKIQLCHMFLSVSGYPFHPDPGGKVNCSAAGDPICGVYGTCVADLLSSTGWSCRCDREYFTTAEDALINITCTTHKPSKTVAIVLAAIPVTGFFGAGALYLNWNIIGTIQFMVVAGWCCLSIIRSYFKSKKKSTTSNSSNIADIYISNNKDNDDSGFQCITKCLFWSVFIAMWIVNLVFISQDCMNSKGIPCIPL